MTTLPEQLSSVIDITVRKEAEERLREANQRKDDRSGR